MKYLEEKESKGLRTSKNLWSQWDKIEAVGIELNRSIEIKIMVKIMSVNLFENGVCNARKWTLVGYVAEI